MATKSLAKGIQEENLAETIAELQNALIGKQLNISAVLGSGSSFEASPVTASVCRIGTPYTEGVVGFRITVNSGNTFDFAVMEQPTVQWLDQQHIVLTGGRHDLGDRWVHTLTIDILD